MKTNYLLVGCCSLYFYHKIVFLFITNEPENVKILRDVTYEYWKLNNEDDTLSENLT